jgi:hypothetical protein
MVSPTGAPPDAFPGGGTANNREVKFGGMLESLIEHDGSSRSRKRISRELGISGSALSQYIHQQSGIIEDLRELLSDQIGGDRVRENCTFRATAAPVSSGMLLYQLDAIRLEVEEPALHAQICDYLHNEVWLGCVARTNSDSNSDMLMDPEHVSRARDAFARMWGSSLAV